MRFGPNNLVERRDYATSQGLDDLVSAGDLSRWLADGDIFAVESNGVVLWPIYALTSPPLTSRPAIRHILAALKMTPWDAADWFCCGCSALGWRRSQDVLPTDPKAALAAASE
jgi:hypothetical protein